MGMGWAAAYAAANGLKTSNPSALKFATLRVTTVNPCTLAVAAIMAGLAIWGSLEVFRQARVELAAEV